MAEQNGSNGGQQPPKITVPNGGGKDQTARIPPTPLKKPDTVTFRSAESKKKTSRIELSDAEAPETAGDGAEEMSVSDVLRQSGKIPLVGKAATARIVMPGAPQGLDVTPRQETAAKDQTVRVDLTSIMAGQKKATGPIATGAKPGDADRTTRIRIEEEPADVDRSTARISLGTETGRIQGETGPVGTGETARITIGGEQTTGEPSTEDRSSTARISLPDEPAGPAPAKPTPPRTVRLQRLSATPKTVVLPRPDAEPTTPRTVVMRKPDDGEEKGATSKISVPEGVMQQAPATQRKTIRIKRAEGPSTARTIAIARPAKPAAGLTVPASQDEALRKLMDETAGGDEPGPAYAILSLVAVLLVGVLLYVLLAQTYAPTLPFPGRIV